MMPEIIEIIVLLGVASSIALPIGLTNNPISNYLLKDNMELKE